MGSWDTGKKKGTCSIVKELRLMLSRASITSTVPSTRMLRTSIPVQAQITHVVWVSGGEKQQNSGMDRNSRHTTSGRDSKGEASKGDSKDEAHL
jgi:hypothetical protein